MSVAFARLWLTRLLAAGVLVLVAAAGQAAPAPFTYQGRLNQSGAPVSGIDDFAFGLYDALDGGLQIGTTVTRTGVVVTGGLFSVQLDFGDEAFSSPGRWLEIEVNSTPLRPRQPLTPAPSAHRAYSISDGIVTAAKMAPGSVAGGPGGTIADGSLAPADLGAGAVTAPKLAAGAVSGGAGGTIADNSITVADLAPPVEAGLVPANSFILTNSTSAPSGYTCTARYLTTSETSGVVTALAPMPTERSVCAAATLNGKVYVMGGRNMLANRLSTLEVYDPASNTWEAKTSMSVARRALAAAALNGKIYAIGGEAATCSATNEVYDPITDTWETTTPMSAARSSLAAAAVNGKIYAIGGTGPSAVNEEYDPVTSTWTVKAPMPTARIAATAVVVNGKIYVMGGNAFESNNEVYDPMTDTWDTKAPVPTARVHMAAAEHHGIVYTLGGYVTSPVALNEAYDPVTDLWSTQAPLLTSRYDLVAAGCSLGVYTIGGNDGGYITVNEEYRPPDSGAITLYVHRKN